MKRIALALLSISLMATSCIKNKITPLGDTGTSTVRFAVSPPAGSHPTQLYVPDLSVDTEYLSMNVLKPKFEAPTVAPADITLTYAVNPEGVTAYNNDHASDPNFKPFEILPDSTYMIVKSSGMIKAGQIYSEDGVDNIAIFTQKVNTTKNYILPISVSGSGYESAPGTGTILFYMIGNPISGNYLWNYYRWNLSSTPPALGTYPSGNPSGWEDDPITFVPIDANTIKVPTGYYYQIDYNISFTDDGNGNLSDFKVEFDQDQYQTYFVNNGVTLTQGPEIVDMGPDYFEINYTVTNGSAWRYIVDYYHK